MGPFFYLKKEIPANPITLVNLKVFKFLLFTPPRAILFFFVWLEMFINLYNPK